MKKLLLLLCIYCLACAFITKNKIFLEKIQIGKFQYSIYKEEGYSHDEDMNSDFFVVYYRNNKRMCSGYLASKHKDSVWITGSYFSDKRRLVKKECYNYPSRFNKWADSTVCIFYPNKHGDLILTNSKVYNDGKIISEDKW